MRIIFCLLLSLPVPSFAEGLIPGSAEGPRSGLAGREHYDEAHYVQTKYLFADRKEHRSDAFRLSFSSIPYDRVVRIMNGSTVDNLPDSVL
jgi:hypothetical protein